MNTSTLPKVFHLTRNDELLAVLESCGPSGEMFWLACDFRPTELFVEVAPLFDEASQTEDMDVFESLYSKLIEMGVVLIDLENQIRIKYFTLDIEEHTVLLRYAEPPYEE